MKVCTKCNTKKAFDQFYKNASTKDGYKYHCIVCEKQYKVDYNIKNRNISKTYNQMYYVKNLDKINTRRKIYNKLNIDKVTKQRKEYRKLNADKYKERNKHYSNKYYKENADKIKQDRANYYKANSDKYKNYARIYKKLNRAKINEYEKKYRETDALFKFSCNIRSLISCSFTRNKTKKYKKLSKTETLLGCTIPELREHLAKQFQEGMTFDNHGEWHVDHRIPLASATTQEEVEKLCHYTNLQPLWASDNIRKGNKT